MYYDTKADTWTKPVRIFQGISLTSFYLSMFLDKSKSHLIIFVPLVDCRWNWLFQTSVGVVLKTNLRVHLHGCSTTSDSAWSSFNHRSVIAQPTKKRSSRGLASSGSSDSRGSTLSNSNNKNGGSPDESLQLPPPPKWNWNATRNTPPIKNQGSTCASCWVNSAVAAVESALSINYNITPITYSYSRQAIVDCANYDNFGQDYALDTGCDGGGANDAIFFMNHFTIPTESVYPYQSGLHKTSVVDSKSTLTWNVFLHPCCFYRNTDA